MIAAYRVRWVAALLFPLSTAAWGAAPSTNDWPNFRGPDRTGVSTETGLLTDWPEGGPELVWQAKGVGRGYSSLAIAGNAVYTLGDGASIADDADEYLFAFDRESGSLLWKLKTGPAWNNGKPTWQSSRSTPTVDGNRVYVVTPASELICCTTDGEEQWRKSLKADFGGTKGDGWGYSESVLVDGDQVVCTPGGGKTTMTALNKLTGETIWSTVRDGDIGAGHASMVVSEVGGTRVYVQTTGSGALGVRASDGELLWSYPIPKTTAVIPTPIVRDDLVFFTAGYNRGGALLRQKPGTDGAVAIEEIYPLSPDLNNKHGGVVLVGDYLYGDSNDQGVIWCAKLMTGEIEWKGRSSGRGSASIVVADGHLYIQYADGTVVLAKADPAAFEEVASFQAPGSGERPSWSHPVVVGGRLYLRQQDLVLGYEIRQKSPTE